MDIHDYHEGMQAHFSITDTHRFLDYSLSRLAAVSLNTRKFDAWVASQLGDYRARGWSTLEAVTLQWGEAASTFMIDAMCPPLPRKKKK